MIDLSYKCMRLAVMKLFQNSTVVFFARFTGMLYVLLFLLQYVINSSENLCTLSCECFVNYMLIYNKEIIPVRAVI